MTIEAVMEEEVLEAGVPVAGNRWHLQWSPVIVGALASAALSFILVGFGVAIGLGVSSTSPTWRDASAALALLSGIYLILQAIVSFGFGGYLAGRTLRPVAGPEEERERRDGVHGLASWALAVLIGAALLALLASSAIDRSAGRNGIGNSPSVAEPLLSFELDKLFRSARRSPNADIREARAEAGRILMTSSSHDGVSSDDRTYLMQQVALLTGLAAPDAERRVDATIVDSRTAITRTRRSSIIVAFSIATAALLGAVAAWAAAAAGGRHRDGEPLPQWMTNSNRLHRARRLPMP
jgi:hypothetical protein